MPERPDLDPDEPDDQQAADAASPGDSGDAVEDATSDTDPGTEDPVVGDMGGEKFDRDRGDDDHDDTGAEGDVAGEGLPDPATHLRDFAQNIMERVWAEQAAADPNGGDDPKGDDDPAGDDTAGDRARGEDPEGDDEDWSQVANTAFDDLDGDWDELAAEFGAEDETMPSLPLDDHESALVRQDLTDLEDFEETFRAEGYRGVSVYCRDCQVEHYYPWELLRENLRMLLETGETPVHEPAFDPDPAHYVPWEYARGYVDALHDLGVPDRIELQACPTCRFELPDDLSGANFCPRCSTPLLVHRIVAALQARGIPDEELRQFLHEIGMPT